MEDSDLKEAIKRIEKEPVEETKEIDSKIKKYKRPSWDEYFLEIAKLVGSRATCDR